MDAHIEAVAKLESFFATGRWSKETSLSLAEDSSDEEVHESRDQQRSSEEVTEDKDQGDPDGGAHAISVCRSPGHASH